MKRIVWIPIAGTVAAILAIAVTHEEPRPEKEPEKPVSTRDAEPDEHEEDGEHEEHAHEEVAEAPLAETYTVKLKPDGKMLVSETGDVFDDVASLLEAIAPADRPAPNVIVTNDSPEVTADAVKDLALKLGERANVKTYHYRGVESGGEE